jgi:hypothetical protein
MAPNYTFALFYFADPVELVINNEFNLGLFCLFKCLWNSKFSSMAPNYTFALCYFADPVEFGKEIMNLIWDYFVFSMPLNSKLI